MFKRIFAVSFFTLFVLSSGNAPAQENSPALTYQPFEATGGYFSCEIPVQEWSLKADPEFDAEYNEYGLELLGPRAEKAPVIIYVTYYAPESDFAGHEDFIERNTRNVAGERKTKTDTFGQAQPMEKDGLKVFFFDRERLIHLYPTTKSDESVMIKEKLYVVPAKSGFYVLHYSAPSSVYEQHLPAFERVFSTFKPGKDLTPETV